MALPGGSVEASRAHRVERQQARFRDRGGIFKPSEHNPLLDLLLARGVNGESPSRTCSPLRSYSLSTSPKHKHIYHTPKDHRNDANTGSIRAPAKKVKGKLHNGKKAEEDTETEVAPVAGTSKSTVTTTSSRKGRSAKIGKKLARLPATVEHDMEGLCASHVGVINPAQAKSKRTLTKTEATKCVLPSTDSVILKHKGTGKDKAPAPDSQLEPQAVSSDDEPLANRKNVQRKAVMSSKSKSSTSEVDVFKEHIIDIQDKDPPLAANSRHSAAAAPALKTDGESLQKLKRLDNGKQKADRTKDSDARSEVLATSDLQKYYICSVTARGRSNTRSGPLQDTDIELSRNPRREPTASKEPLAKGNDPLEKQDVKSGRKRSKPQEPTQERNKTAIENDTDASQQDLVRKRTRHWPPADELTYDASAEPDDDGKTRGRQRSAEVRKVSNTKPAPVPTRKVVRLKPKPRPRMSMFQPPPPDEDSDRDPIDFLS